MKVKFWDNYSHHVLGAQMLYRRWTDRGNLKLRVKSPPAWFMITSVEKISTFLLRMKGIEWNLTANQTMRDRVYNLSLFKSAICLKRTKSSVQNMNKFRVSAMHCLIPKHWQEVLELYGNEDTGKYESSLKEKTRDRNQSWADTDCENNTQDF